MRTGFCRLKLCILYRQLLYGTKIVNELRNSEMQFKTKNKRNNKNKNKRDKNGNENKRKEIFEDKMQYK